MLKARVITAIFLLIGFLAALFLLSPLGWTLLATVVAMLAAWEWGGLMRLVGIQRIAVALLLGVPCTTLMLAQPEALGLGHAVLCSKPVIGDEPFAVLLADDLLVGTPAVMKQMTDTYDYYRCSVLGVQDVPRADTKSYGIVDARKVAERVEQVNAIVEKPKPEDAPSTLAVVGRYILTPRIFHHLENIKPGAGGEIQLTDGIASLLGEEQVLAYRYDGIRYDCGSKLGYLQATVDLGRRHPEVGPAFDTYLKNLEA